MLVPILSLIISAAAFLLTILIYRQRRTFENENYFFNYKLEQYGNIIRSASELLELLFSNLHDLKDELEEDNSVEVQDEIEMEIEDKMRDFRVILHKGCAFVPNNIIESLNELYDQILETQESTMEQSRDISKIDKAITNIEVLTDQLDQIINEMRADMGIENIDTRLKKRAR